MPESKMVLTRCDLVHADIDSEVADEIMRRWDMFEEMLAVLEALDKDWTDWIPGGPDYLPESDPIMNIWRAARAAIVKAKGTIQ